MAQCFEVTPVGWVRSVRTQPIDDGWDAVASAVELDAARFGPEALAGLESFSHVEIVYLFDRADPARVTAGARHPRGRADWPKVGIFGQRGKDRPNRIGVTAAAVLRVDGTRLELRGLDAVDATPVLDIKPVMSGFLPRGALVEPDWAREIMRRYW